MEVKASKAFFDTQANTLRRPRDTFEVSEKRAQVLSAKGVIERTLEVEEKAKPSFLKKEK